MFTIEKRKQDTEVFVAGKIDDAYYEFYMGDTFGRNLEHSEAKSSKLIRHAKRVVVRLNNEGKVGEYYE